MDGENWYGYANNNPVKYVDPNGLESYEVIQSLINREKSVERAREYKNIAAESNAKGRSQYEAGRKEYNKIEEKVIRFNNERERFIKKYYNSNKKNSIPVEQSKYRITCGNTDAHKGRTQGGVNKNRFVTDYAADEGTPVFTTAKTEFKTNAQRWSYNDSSFSSQTVTLEDGEEVTVHTYGKGYGFRINGTIENGTINVWFAHGNPNSIVAKDFAILQMMAKEAELQGFTLPENTQIMEIGLTGLTTGPHLHCEEDIK